MTVKIKALSREEFEAACTDGCVYGEFQGRRDVYTYANLGMEKEYIPSPNDDPKTEYRIFTGCSVFFAKTKKQLFEEDFEAQELPEATVIIYYQDKLQYD